MASPQAFDPLFDEPRDAKMYTGLKGRTYLGPTVKRDTIARCELPGYPHGSQASGSGIGEVGKAGYGSIEAQRRAGMSQNELQLPFDPNNPLTPRLLGRDMSPRSGIKRVPDADGQGGSASEDGRTTEEMADEMWSAQGYASPMYLGATGEIYDYLYEPIPKSMRMRTDLDSNPAKFLEQQQNTRTFEIAPFPMPEHDHSSYFEWEQEVLVWKDRTERQMRGLRPVSMSGRHLYRPRQNRPHSLGERKVSQDVILSSTPDQTITSLPNSDTGSTGDGKYHSSSSPMRSLNSAGPLNPHEDESSDAEHPTWDAILIPAEPNPVHYHTFEDYKLAMTRWAVLVQRLSAKIAPAPRQLPALLQLTNHAIIPPRPFSETNPLRYSANGTSLYGRHNNQLQASTESSEEDYEDDDGDENEFGDELGDRSRSGLLQDRIRSVETGEDGESTSDVATQRMKLKRRSAMFDPAAIANLASPANSNPNIIGYDKRKSLKISRLPLTLISQGSGWWDSDSSTGSPQGKQSPDPTDPGYHVFTPQMRSVRSPGRTTPRSRPSTRRFATPHTSLLPGRPGLSTHSHPSNTIDTPHRSPAPSSPLEPLPPLIPKSARGNLMPSTENNPETLSARGQPSEHLRKAQNFSAKHSGYIMSDKMKSRIQRQLVDLLQRQQQRYQNTGRFGAEPIRGIDKRPFSANPATANHSIYPEINYKQLMSATVATKKSMAEAHRTTLWLAHPSRSFELDVPFIHLSPLGPRHLAANQTSPVSLPMLSEWVETLVSRPRESSRTTSSNSAMWVALQEAIGNVHIDSKLHPNGSAIHTLSLLDVPSFISLLATDFSTTTSEGASEKSPRKTNLISHFAIWLFPTVRRAKPEPLSPRSSSVQSDSASMSKRTIRSNKSSRMRHLQMVLKLAQDIQQPKALFKLSYLLYLSIATRPRQSSEIFAILFESVAQAAPKPDNEFGEPLSQMPQQSGEERLSDDESLQVPTGGRHRSGSTSSAATNDVPVLSFSGISLSSGGSDTSTTSTTTSGQAYEESLHSALFLLNFGRSVPIDYYTWYKSQLPSFPDFSTAHSPKPDSASSKESTEPSWEIKDTATRLAAAIERAYQCQLLARCVMEGLLPSYIPPTPSGGSSKSSFSSASNAQSKLTSSLPFPFAVQESPSVFSRRMFECWRTEVSLCLTILTKNLKEEMVPEEEATSSSNDSDAFHDATKTMPGLPSETARLIRFLLSRTGLGSRSRLVSSLSHFVISWILQFDSHLNFWRDVCQIDISREISPPSPNSAASSKQSGPHIMVSSESMDGDTSTAPSIELEPDERLASSTASSATFSRSATNASIRPSRAGISSYPAQFRTLLQRPSVKFVELVNHALKSKLIHVKTLAANIVELCMHHDAYQSAPPTASRGSTQQPQPWVQLWATRLGGVAILDGLTHGLPSRSSIPGYGSMGTASTSTLSTSSSSLGGIISPRALSTRNSSDFFTFLNPAQAEVSELTKRRLTSPPLASVSSEVWHAIFWKVCGPALALVEATTPASQFIAGKTQMSAAPQWLHPHPPMDQSHAMLDHLMFGSERTDGTTYLLGASTNPNQVRWSWEGAQGVPGVSPPPLPTLHTSNSGSSLSSSSSGNTSSPSPHLTPTPPGPADMALMHPFSYIDQAMTNDLPLASLRDANLFHRTLGRLLKAEPGAHSQILASTLILVAGSLRRHALIVPKLTPGSAVPGPRSEVSGQSVPLSMDHILRLLVYVTTPVSNALHGGERASIFRVRTSCIKLLQLILTTPPILNWLTSNVNLPLITTTPAFSFVPGSSHSITSPTNHSGFLSASGILERSGSASSFASNSGMVSPITAGRRRKPWGITGSTDPSGGSNDHLSTVHSPGSTANSNSSPGSPFDLDLPKGEVASAIRKDSLMAEKDFGSTPSSLENALLPLLSANSSPPTTPRAIPSSSVPSPQQSQPGSIEADSILRNAGSSSVSSFSSLSALRLAYGGAPPANSSPASSLGSTSPLTSSTSGEVPTIPSLPMPNLTVESSAAVWLAMVEGLIAVIRFGTDLSSAMAASECLRNVIFARPMIMEVFLKPLPVQVPNIFAPMLKKDAKKGTSTTISVEDLILQARQSGARAHSSIASANASGASTGATVSSSVTNYTTPSSWLLCAAPSPLGTSGLTWAVPTLEASLPVFLRLHACLSVGQSQSATTTLFSHLVDGLNASHSLNNVAHCLFALNQLFSGPVVPLPIPSYLSSNASASANAANASIQATLATKSFKTMLTYFVTHHLFIKVHLVYKRLLEDDFIKALLEPHTIITQPVNASTPVRNLAKSTPLDSAPCTPTSHATEPEADSIERKSTGNRSGFLSGIFGKKVLSQSSSVPSSPSSSSMPTSSAQTTQPTTPSMPSTPPSSKPSPNASARGSVSNHQSNTPVVRQSFGLDANGIPTALRPPVVLNAAPGAHLALMQLACLYHTLSTSQACHKVMKAAKGNIEFMEGIRILSRFHSAKLTSESVAREFPGHGRPFSLSKPTPIN